MFEKETDKSMTGLYFDNWAEHCCICGNRTPDGVAMLCDDCASADLNWFPPFSVKGWMAYKKRRIKHFILKLRYRWVV